MAELKKNDILIGNNLNIDHNNLGVINDPVFSSTIRLTIMMILNANQKVGFTELRKLLNLTPGNMDHHVKSLEQVAYLEKLKSFNFNRPMTILHITLKGRIEVKDYVNRLSQLINRM